MKTEQYLIPSDPPSSQQDIIVKEIALQASKYVGAIQAGVSAAYSGFTVTEEVLFLASLDSVEDEEDLHQYLAGMMELAKQARDNAHKAHEAFRTVRTEIYAVSMLINNGIVIADSNTYARYYVDCIQIKSSSIRQGLRSSEIRAESQEPPAI